MWLVIENDETVQVIPQFGIGHHEQGLWCHCGPKVEMYPKPLVIHNAMTAN